MANKGAPLAIGLAALGLVVLGGYYVLTQPEPVPEATPEPAPETASSAPAAPEAEPQPEPVSPLPGVGAIPGDTPGPFLTIAVAGQQGAGEIVIDLAAELAPGHAAQLTALAGQGFYDGVYFHRVIDGFMAQTGDGVHGKVQPEWEAGAMRRAGTGGSDRDNLKAEFSDIPFERGIVGMARSQSEDSANSQFFIMFDEASFLNGQYTVVGRVTQGLDVLDRIKRGDSSTFQVTGEPDRMVTVRVTE
jgi:peptidylprolyl isomerase